MNLVRNLFSPLPTSHSILALPLALFLACTLAPSLASAQPFSSLPRITEVEIDTLRDEPRKHLDRVRDFLVDKQYDEAVDTLLRIMETNGQALVALANPTLPPKPAGPAAPGQAEEPRRPKDPTALPAVSYLPLAEYGQIVLASWAEAHPEALALYRRRVDPRAERFLKDAREKREPALLARIVREMFASSFGDEALLALGDFELERGHPQAARALWERISPVLRTSPAIATARKVAPGAPLAWALRKVDWKKDGAAIAREVAKGREGLGTPAIWVAYPDSDLDLAEVRARLILASIFEADLPRARTELALFRELHPTAKGILAGREGVWAERLAEQLAEAERWPRERSDELRTFALNQERNAAAPAPTEAGGGPLWSIAVDPLRIADQRDFTSRGRERVAEDFDGLLSYHPLVVDEKLFLYTGDRLRVFDAATGKPVWRDGVIHSPRNGELPLGVGDRVGVPRYTLTACNSPGTSRLFLRAGPPVTSAIEDPREVLEGKRGYLLGFNLNLQGYKLEHFPLDTEDRSWAFEGTPLADDSSLYVAMRHLNRQIHVAAYDLSSGRIRWRRQVCAGQPLADEQHRIVSHLLLSRHEDTLYLNTSAGAVAALDVASGALKWVVTYPRIVGNPHQPWQAVGQHWFRDLTPCVVHHGVVIAAPADSDHLFGIDAATGIVLWESPPGQGSDVVHLLGVAGDRLIASGDYLYWIDLFTGRFVGQFPENGHPATGGGKPSPSGYGRGLLAGDSILWPTRQQIYVFRQALGPDGVPQFVRQPIELGKRDARGGNLLIAGETLIIAGTDHIWGFDPYGRRSAAPKDGAKTPKE